MKYTSGKSWFNKSTQEWEYKPRVYTNYYCSLKEWAKLSRGKDIFMYQLRNAIAEKIFFRHKYNKEYYQNGTYKLSFDRTGRRDGLSSEIYSADIIKEVIKSITNRESEVEFYSWKGNIDHVEISFPDATAMPNIICLIDEYDSSSTNRTLIFIIDCIYKVLGWKTIDWYDKYLYQFYNKEHDFVFLNPGADKYIYPEWVGKTGWKEIIKRKSNRQYDPQYYKTKIIYK